MCCVHGLIEVDYDTKILHENVHCCVRDHYSYTCVHKQKYRMRKYIIVQYCIPKTRLIKMGNSKQTFIALHKSLAHTLQCLDVQRLKQAITH